ncbi:MAG: hypothetical protein V3T30_05330 [Thermodesulfobacteriota bacterium]
MSTGEGSRIPEGMALKEPGEIVLKWPNEQKIHDTYDRAEKWVVEESLVNHYQGSDACKIRCQIRKRAGKLYSGTTIHIDEEDYIAVFHIRLGRLNDLYYNSSVFAVERVESKQNIYEYWVITRGRMTKYFSSDENSLSISFLITKSEGLDKKRKVIYRSPKYFSKYTAPDGTVIKFPTENNKIISELYIEEYPEAFKGTELEGIKAILVGSPYKYEKVKVKYKPWANSSRKIR